MSDLIAGGYRGNLECTAMDGSQVERELQVCKCEFAILDHAKRLREITGKDHTLDVLAEVVRMVTSEPPERSLH